MICPKKVETTFRKIYRPQCIGLSNHTRHFSYIHAVLSIQYIYIFRSVLGGCDKVLHFSCCNILRAALHTCCWNSAADHKLFIW